MAKGQDTAIYEREKLEGIRRRDGAKTLEQIKPRHKQIIALHLSGYKNKEIAQVSGYTEAWISTLLRDPIVKELLEEAYNEQSQRLKALFSDVVDSLKDGLDPRKAQIKDRLKASEVWHKLNGDINKEGAGATDSAENIVGRILQEAKDGEVNVQINQYGRNE